MSILETSLQLDEQQVADYFDNGFYIARGLLNTDQALEINKILDKTKPKVFIPYSENVPWGYGNLIKNEYIEKIFSLNILLNLVSPLLKEGNLKCNHLMAVNKAPFIGPDVEWHQEFFNINTYAPGYSPLEDLNNFIQIFVALDEHDETNGPLEIFEQSHKDGILPHESIINMNIGHKRRVTFDALLKLSKKRKQTKLLLKPGDAVFFNHLLVHGSQTNISSKRRRALLYQIRVDDKIMCQETFNNESKYRNQFIIEKCKKIIAKLKKENIYSEFKSKKEN